MAASAAAAATTAQTRPRRAAAGCGATPHRGLRRLISSPFRRRPGPSLDRYHHQELDRLLAGVASLFTVETPITRPD